MNKLLKYSDVTLMPRYSKVSSRSECDISTKLDETFRSPVVPANMKASIDFETAKWLAKNGYFYILHRFYENEEVLDWIKNNQLSMPISISVGVKEKDLELLREISKRGLRVDYITIDIAHGHSALMKNTIKFIKELEFKSSLSSYGKGLFQVQHNCPASRGIYSIQLKYNPFIIAGNVATPEAVVDLESWGADAVKVGIGQGHVCTTKDKTGFTVPMFSCVFDCANVAKKPIIADGGIHCHGDIAKAIVAGASMVMIGSMFARCIDSPAELVISYQSPRIYKLLQDKNWDALLKCGSRIEKRWYGSASEHNKGEYKHVEGICRTEPTNGKTYESMFTEIKQDLQSAISYGGGTKLSDLRRVTWEIIA